MLALALYLLGMLPAFLATSVDAPAYKQVAIVVLWPWHSALALFIASVALAGGLVERIAR
jgi:hypothetical protein